MCTPIPVNRKSPLAASANPPTITTLGPDPRQDAARKRRLRLIIPRENGKKANPVRTAE